MRSRLAATALLLLLVGCSDGATPSGPLLLGQWGAAGESPALLMKHPGDPYQDPISATSARATDAESPP